MKWSIQQGFSSNKDKYIISIQEFPARKEVVWPRRFLGWRVFQANRDDFFPRLAIGCRCAEMLENIWLIKKFQWKNLECPESNKLYCGNLAASE